jgi:hypothetical protein
MKRFLFIFSLFLFVRASAQNEFAAAAFYKEFRKIYSDGQTGFQTCKGSLHKTGLEAIQAEFRSKCLLMLADSGKIIFPRKGNPYAIYFFEPDKYRLKVDQRGLNLKEAVVTAFENPLFARTETSIINGNPYTRTLFFANAEHERSADAIFIMQIYFNTGKYFLSFEIKGKSQDKE